MFWNFWSRLVWTADDQRIFYNSGDYLCSTSIDPNADATCNTIRFAWQPALSPDGRTIAFSVGDPITSVGGIYVMNVDGSGAREILHISGGYDWWGTTWSSDGKAIFFTTNASRASGPQDIRRLDITTGAVTTVASGIQAGYNESDW